jgi:hypothetical protein
MRARLAPVARPHFIIFDRWRVINASRCGPPSGAKWSRAQTFEVAMIDSRDFHRDRTYPPAATPFAAARGERWRRFLERVGTRSNDFASRLSRARFVYLHRRETSTHWLPL